MSALRKIFLAIVILSLVMIQVTVVSAQEVTLTPNGIQAKITQVDNSKFPSVTAYISVTDANGEPVQVSPAQIILEEDGQRITPDMILSEGDVGALTTMLVMDISGSMNSNNKLEAAKAAAEAYVNQARPSDLIGLMTFNTKVEYVQSLTTDHKLLIDAIKNLKAKDDTAMYDALLKAIETIQREAGRVAIILLTDGLDNRSKISPQEVLTRIGPGGLSISTIGLGDPTQSRSALSSLDEKALKALADKAGGGYGYANDEVSLRSLYERYGRALQSEYVIAYTSPSALRDGVNRRLNVSLELEPGQQAGAAVSPVSYNPGGLVPEVAQSAPWMWFFIMLIGLLLLLFVPLLIGGLLGKRRSPDKANKHVRLGPKIKLRS
jgi:VWFA-related protein